MWIGEEKICLRNEGRSRIQETGYLKQTPNRKGDKGDGSPVQTNLAASRNVELNICD